MISFILRHVKDERHREVIAHLLALISTLVFSALIFLMIALIVGY